MRQLRRILVAFALLAVMASAGAGERDMPLYQTRFYNIYSDLDKTLAEDLAKRMDVVYQEYARRLGDFSPPRDARKFDVFIFTRQADYRAFTGDRFARTGGIFMPSRNALAAMLEGQGRDALRRTLQHEAFHQFVHMVFGPKVPIWLNEGLAQVFEEGVWVSDQFMMGQAPPRRTRQFQDDVKNKRLMQFRAFMALDAEQWHKRALDQAHGTTMYNQAWMMTHYLVYARDEQGKVLHRTRMLKMLKLLHEGKDGESAFKEAFSDNIDGFQQRVLEYGMALQPSPEALVVERATILSDFLSALHERGQRFDHIDDFRQAIARDNAQMHYTRGTLKWSSDPDPLVYFRDIRGRQLDNSVLYLQPRRDVPLPDIVWKADRRLYILCRFYQLSNRWEHEVLLYDPLRRSSARTD